MINRKISTSIALLGTALLAALSGAASAQQHVEDARVISSTPVRTPDGQTSYSVTYEYGGRQYTTRPDSAPGDYIQLQLSPMGVMAAQPAQPDAQATNYPDAEPWRNVQPEPGVVLSGNSGGAVATARVYTPAPAAYPAPVAYPAPAPVYAPAYGYYGYPYAAYPPIGLSLNFGYSSWRGGRGWR